MPIKDPIIRKEYARISMLIKYARDRGEDTSQLLEQRKSIIPGIRSNGIIPSIKKDNIIPQSGIRKTGIRGINIKPNSQQQLNEIKTSLTELQNQLQILTSELPNFHTKISNELINFRQEILNLLSTKKEQTKPTEISIKKQPKKVIIKEHKSEVKTSSQLVNKANIKFDKNLLVKVQSFLTDNKEIFLSFAQLVKDSISAYLQKKIAINPAEQFHPSEKKTVRLSGELNNFYLSLPDGKKTLILNQILSAFLSSQN